LEWTKGVGRRPIEFIVARTLAAMADDSDSEAHEGSFSAWLSTGGAERSAISWLAPGLGFDVWAGSLPEEHLGEIALRTESGDGENSGYIWVACTVEGWGEAGARALLAGITSNLNQPARLLL
jgi:hypothetical protein